jgi:hypothetical protein
MTYGPKLMLVPDAELAAEIADYRKEIANLLKMSAGDRIASDRQRLSWLEAKYAELEGERSRRQRRVPAAPQASAASASAISGSRRPEGDDFEGPPIIIVDKGTARVWRPGDRIHRKPKV